MPRTRTVKGKMNVRFDFDDEEIELISVPFEGDYTYYPGDYDQAPESEGAVECTWSDEQLTNGLKVHYGVEKIEIDLDRKRLRVSIDDELNEQVFQNPDLYLVD